MKLLFFAIQTTWKAKRRQPLEEQPYIYEIARLSTTFDPVTQEFAYDTQYTQRHFVRPKAELHPRVQSILKLSRESLDSEPDFSEIITSITDAIEDASLLVSHDRMYLQSQIEHELQRASHSYTFITPTLSLAVLSKDRADMRTRRNKRLRPPTLKELHTKLFGAQRIELYTAQWLVEAQCEVFEWLIDKKIIKYDDWANEFISLHRNPWVYYRAR